MVSHDSGLLEDTLELSEKWLEIKSNRLTIKGFEAFSQVIHSLLPTTQKDFYQLKELCYLMDIDKSVGEDGMDWERRDKILDYLKQESLALGERKRGTDLIKLEAELIEKKTLFLAHAAQQGLDKAQIETELQPIRSVENFAEGIHQLIASIRSSWRIAQEDGSASNNMSESPAKFASNDDVEEILIHFLPGLHLDKAATDKAAADKAATDKAATDKAAADKAAADKAAADKAAADKAAADKATADKAAIDIDKAIKVTETYLELLTKPADKKVSAATVADRKTVSRVENLKDPSGSQKKNPAEKRREVPVGTEMVEDPFCGSQKVSSLRLFLNALYRRKKVTEAYLELLRKPADEKVSAATVADRKTVSRVENLKDPSGSQKKNPAEKRREVPVGTEMVEDPFCGSQKVSSPHLFLSAPYRKKDENTEPFSDKKGDEALKNLKSALQEICMCADQKQLLKSFDGSLQPAFAKVKRIRAQAYSLYLYHLNYIAAVGWGKAGTPESLVKENNDLLSFIKRTDAYLAPCEQLVFHLKKTFQAEKITEAIVKLPSIEEKWVFSSNEQDRKERIALMGKLEPLVAELSALRIKVREDLEADRALFNAITVYEQWISTLKRVTNLTKVEDDDLPATDVYKTLAFHLEKIASFGRQQGVAFGCLLDITKVEQKQETISSNCPPATPPKNPGNPSKNNPASKEVEENKENKPKTNQPVEPLAGSADPSLGLSASNNDPLEYLVNPSKNNPASKEVGENKENKPETNQPVEPLAGSADPSLGLATSDSDPLEDKKENNFSLALGVTSQLNSQKRDPLKEEKHPVLPERMNLLLKCYDQFQYKYFLSLQPFVRLHNAHSGIKKKWLDKLLTKIHELTRRGGQPDKVAALRKVYLEFQKLDLSNYLLVKKFLDTLHGKVPSPGNKAPIEILESFGDRRGKAKEFLFSFFSMRSVSKTGRLVNQLVGFVRKEGYQFKSYRFFLAKEQNRAFSKRNTGKAFSSPGEEKKHDVDAGRNSVSPVKPQ